MCFLVVFIILCLGYCLQGLNGKQVDTYVNWDLTSYDSVTCNNLISFGTDNVAFL